MSNSCFLWWTSRCSRCVAKLGGFNARVNTLDLNACHTLAVHFRNSKTPAAVFESLASFGNKSQLRQNESSYRGISWVFRQRNVVLRVQIAHIQRGIENNRAIRQCQRLLDYVKFVMNLTHHLFENVLQGNQSKNAAKFVYDHGHPDMACTKLGEQFAGRFGLRHDQYFSQHPPQIERRRLFCSPTLA